MGTTTYKLRIGDFKKMIRHILTFLGLGLIVFLTSFLLHRNGFFANSPISLEVFLVSYFLLTAAIFMFLVFRNNSNEQLTLDSGAIQSSRFGSIYFSDIVRHRFQRHKNSEDIILTLTNGMKIFIGPVNGSKIEDKKIYENFKEIILTKLDLHNS